MSKDYSEYFSNLIKFIWIEAGAWPDYAETMRFALSLSGRESLDQSPGMSRWARLPGLCCQAAGGDFAWAHDITAAWILFYFAAHIMDAVQDGDPAEEWWQEAGAGVAINTASGLYFTASQILQNLHISEYSQTAASDVIQLFYKTGLVMCAGQHRDLTSQVLGLDEYWSMAAAKSGVFFALACQTGARLAMKDPIQLQQFADFGRSLGVLIQILDDLDEFRSSKDASIPGIGRKLLKSLPAVYALAVLDDSRKDHLLSLLKAAPADAGATLQAIEIIDGCGAALFVNLQIDVYRRQALNALTLSAANSEARVELELMLNSI